MKKLKTYAIIHFNDGKTKKVTSETVSKVKWEYPEAIFIELFNYSNIRLVSTNGFCGNLPTY